jgi:hypothetical protein
MAHHHSDHHHAPARRASVSLFRMGIGGRLAIALGASALLWAAIGWALA